MDGENLRFLRHNGNLIQKNGKLLHLFQLFGELLDPYWNKNYVLRIFQNMSNILFSASTASQIKDTTALCSKGGAKEKIKVFKF